MGVQRIPVSVNTRWPDGRTNAYLVDGAGGLLVDPGTAEGALTAAVERRSVDHVAVTHAHGDHVDGVAYYARRCEATVWARAGYGGRFSARTGIEPDRTFREGTAVGPTTVVETPGHAPDHVAFRIGDDALVGDLAVAKGSLFVGGSDGDLRAYLVSLRRLRQAGLSRLFPGHGGIVEDADATLERLLRHRRHRERRVLEAVHQGARDLEAITAAAYDKDLTGVADLARMTVAAHLEKLSAAGRLEWDGARAAPA